MSVVRVAIDAGPLHGRRTGIGNAVAWTFDALAERHDVELQPYVVSMRAVVRPPQRRLPIPAALAHRWWAGRAPAVDRLLRRGRSHPPDVLHGTNYVVPPASIPRLVSVYDCWFLRHPEQAHPVVTRAAAVLRRSVADGATVLACSAATAAHVRELLDTDRVATVLLGPPPINDEVPVRPSALEPASDEPFVLSLGTLEVRKNVPGLVRAFARLAHEHEHVRLVIAGADGDDAHTVDAAISALEGSARSRVHRLGPVTGAEKQWLLRQARVLAYPSSDEGFGFPILEAHQAGTPVVAAAAGSIPEVAGRAALLSAVGDADALAAHLHWVVTSDDMHAKLRRRGTANLQRFDWADTADRLTALYHRLREGSSR